MNLYSYPTKNGKVYTAGKGSLTDAFREAKTLAEEMHEQITLEWCGELFAVTAKSIITELVAEFEGRFKKYKDEAIKEEENELINKIKSLSRKQKIAIKNLITSFLNER